MAIREGFYRHWRDGDVFFVRRVDVHKHDGDKRVVSYTSIRTINEGLDGLARDEDDFEQWVDPRADGAVAWQPAPGATPPEGYVPRFARLERPEELRVPLPPLSTRIPRAPARRRRRRGAAGRRA